MIRELEAAHKALGEIKGGRPVCLSFDGDADRIVYFIPDFKTGNLDVLDGEKLLTLLTMAFFKIISEIDECFKECLKIDPLMKWIDFKQWHFGIVQTAYANSSSRKFLEKTYKQTWPAFEFITSPTGVKYSHHFASQFDWGIYFESNGHGAFVFKAQQRRLIQSYAGFLEKHYLSKGKPFKKQLTLFKLLDSWFGLTNLAAGDSMANFLLIQSGLRLLDLSVEKWHGVYKEMVASNTKCQVKDKSKIKVNFSEDRIVTPPEIQFGIDKIIGGFPNSRAFVRPSGTEDIVRIYVETKTKGENEIVREKIKRLIVSNEIINPKKGCKRMQPKL